MKKGAQGWPFPVSLMRVLFDLEMSLIPPVILRLNSLESMYSGTSPCGHPTYVDTMLLWILFLGPIHGVHSIISFTTVNTSQLWTLFVRPSGGHIIEVLLYCICIVAWVSSATGSSCYRQKKWTMLQCLARIPAGLSTENCSLLPPASVVEVIEYAPSVCVGFEGPTLCTTGMVQSYVVWHYVLRHLRHLIFSVYEMFNAGGAGSLGHFHSGTVSTERT